ncbi:D-isomer specific 2-hydroxyacid dehydrogenase NAD-binding protein [Planoprotostelium fungivorum]|uniref:D-isomer specific 2-hydroxyacid dehydrogenase NAD-binding protein n=1 Tax=Planoprotostelium fungivorum TaxID=1890364 RepID=A0A2P6NUF9_9EUKA|nr:D-isomer specific 2-hydroxyacid dehydrogenase NAD-binding protein [Planoprotostelium fungivorum]
MQRAIANSTIFKSTRCHATLKSTRPYDKKYLELENKNRGSPHKLSFVDSSLTKENAKLAEGSKAVCLFVNDDGSKEVLDKLHKNGTDLILLRCAGYDRIDLKAAEKKKISVRNVPAYSPHAVAEFAAGLTLTLNRKIHKAYNRVRDQNFELNGLMGSNLHGKTVGVMGTGQIGQIFVNIMLGFGCRVIAWDVKRNPELEGLKNFSYVEHDQLLASSDIISLHLPLTEDTKNVINEDNIKKMKKGVTLVNTSRGALVDPKAVTEAVRSNRIGALALDVWPSEHEFFFANKDDEVIQDDDLNALLQYPNVIITSHQAFFTHEAMESIVKTVFDNLEANEKSKDTNELAKEK